MLTKINFNSRPIQYLTLAGLALIWGSSFILMKRGLVSFPPMEVAALRLFVVFIVMIPSTIKYIGVLNASNRVLFFAIGIFGSAFPYFLFIVAQTQISSSLNGVLNSLTPLFTLLFSMFFLKSKVLFKSIVGICLGLIGVVGLIYFSDEFGVSQGFTAYMFLPIIASASYGFNVNIIKFKLKDVNPIAVTALSFAIIGPLAGIYLLLFSDFISHTQSTQGMQSLGYIVILGVMGTALALLIFNMLIKYTTSLFASSVTYVIPIIAIMWGLVDGEKFNVYQALFVCVILLGVGLINARGKALPK